MIPRGLVVALALASSSVALADADFVLPQPPQPSVPSSDVEIATNAHIVFQGSLDSTPTFTRDDVGEVLFFETFALPDPLSGRALVAKYLVDPGNLAGLDTLTITASCDGCTPRTSSWIVGDAPDETPPTIGEGEVSAPRVSSTGVEDVFGYHARGWFLDVTIPRVLDDSGFVLVRIEKSESEPELATLTPFADGTISISATYDAGPVRTVCFSATALDLALNETPLVENVCAEIGDDDDGGCRATPLSISPFAIVLLVVRRVRRPRTRPIV